MGDLASGDVSEAQQYGGWIVWPISGRHFTLISANFFSDLWSFIAGFYCALWCYSYLDKGNFAQILLANQTLVSLCKEAAKEASKGNGLLQKMLDLSVRKYTVGGMLMVGITWTVKLTWLYNEA